MDPGVPERQRGLSIFDGASYLTLGPLCAVSVLTLPENVVHVGAWCLETLDPCPYTFWFRSLFALMLASQFLMVRSAEHAGSIKDRRIIKLMS